jgi:2-polyprenyl-6-methoxyphenol hydroxylase-like FAD-dependent oxidoreductase
MTEAEKYKNVKYHFGQKCLTIDLRKPKITFWEDKTKTRTEVECDLLFGCDGVSQF